MNKTILIIPTIREIYKNQFELCVDFRLINFFYRINKNFKIKIANTKKITSFDYLILSGGNDILKNSQKIKDLKRHDYDNYYFKFALKKKRVIIGICHGALFIADKFNSKILKTNLHVKSHYIKNKNKKIYVNSFHNFKIFKASKYLKPDYLADDKSIESFQIKNKKIYGIMWHPERYKKYKNFDLNFFKKIICT